MGAFNSISEGSPKATRRGEENVIFPWREIARCFWATSVAKGLFDSVEFLNLRKKSKMCILDTQCILGFLSLTGHDFCGGPNTLSQEKQPRVYLDRAANDKQLSNY